MPTEHHSCLLQSTGLASNRNQPDLAAGQYVFKSMVRRSYSGKMLIMGRQKVVDPAGVIHQDIPGACVISYFLPPPPNEIWMRLMWKELKYKQGHSLRICLCCFVPEQVFGRAAGFNRHFYAIV